MVLMRIPYTDALPLPRIIPSSAITRSGAIAALTDFLVPSSTTSSRRDGQTVLLTGAGISVASGLNDYRGPTGTYVVNKSYRPIYYHEFISHHESRQRYWARSFLGWTNLHKAKPNGVHWAIKRLGELGSVSSVITQNVDSFHKIAHPDLATVELHGFLRSNVCLSCNTHMSRESFQQSLAALNPAWATFLDQLLANGALTTEDPSIRRQKGLRTNPDGDVDLPDAPYSTFRYPACPTCVANPPMLPSGERGKVEMDTDGAYRATSTCGILKPAVVMFGEAIPPTTKAGADAAILGADKILVVGSSLATYSAFRLVKRARELGMSIGILNLGGVRGEEVFFGDVEEGETRRGALRCSMDAQEVLPDVVQAVEKSMGKAS